MESALREILHESIDKGVARRDHWKISFLSTSQNRSQEEENREPPQKKEKLMETKKKASKLSLKQKASNQPLAQGNK